jgi:hypothetical protein
VPSGVRLSGRLKVAQRFIAGIGRRSKEKVREATVFEVKLKQAAPLLSSAHHREA